MKLKHIVMWNYSREFSAEQNQQNANRIKSELEALLPVIDGLLEIKVVFPIKQTSDFEIALDSTFESENALKAYQIHPEHVKAASFIKQVLVDRKCIDYLI